MSPDERSEVATLVAVQRLKACNQLRTAVLRCEVARAELVKVEDAAGVERVERLQSQVVEAIGDLVPSLEEGAPLRSGWIGGDDWILRRELIAILREIGRRRYGESLRSAGGWSILTVPLAWALPPPDPYTQARVQVDERNVRIVVNDTLVPTVMSDGDVLRLIEWLGAIYTSGAWPMERPAWPARGSSDVQ